MVAAVGVALELVEAGEAGAEQGVVAGAGEGCEGLHGLGEVGAEGVGEAGLDASRREDFTRFADQGDVADAWRDAVDEAGDVAALRFAAGDEQDGGEGEEGGAKMEDGGEE